MKVKVPRNIKKYETKLMGGMTTRNLIFLIIGFAFVAVWVFLLHNILPYSMLFIVSFLLSLPIFLMGFLKVSNIYLDKVIVKVIKAEILGADRREYKTRGFIKHEKKK
ncbi:MAG: PrgI family protein [Oscillospiraceae bacterium]